MIRHQTFPAPLRDALSRAIPTRTGKAGPLGSRDCVYEQWRVQWNSECSRRAAITIMRPQTWFPQEESRIEQATESGVGDSN